MSSPAVKLSVSVPSELAASLRKRVGQGALSSFVARAVSHELEREALGALLGRLDEKLGPVSKSSLDEARRAWRRR